MLCVSFHIIVSMCKSISFQQHQNDFTLYQLLYVFDIGKSCFQMDVFDFQIFPAVIFSKIFWKTVESEMKRCSNEIDIKIKLSK